MGLKAMEAKDLPPIKPVIPEVKEETVKINLSDNLETEYPLPPVENPQEKIKYTIMSKIILSDPRLNGLPSLLLLFVEIMMYRLHGKKNKVGILKATINQISCAIEITEEDLDERNSV